MSQKFQFVNFSMIFFQLSHPDVQFFYCMNQQYICIYIIIYIQYIYIYIYIYTVGRNFLSGQFFSTQVKIFSLVFVIFKLHVG